MTSIAFIGLGTMGYPMAGHLARAGLNVTVFNRTAAKAEAWCSEFGGNKASSPANAAENADFALICVGNDDDLREVVTGPEGVLGSLKPGALLVDHSTVSASVSRELAGHVADCGARFVDAPVSGGQQGAINGQLTIMCGGDASDVSDAGAIIRHYARAVTHMGPVGNGQRQPDIVELPVSGENQKCC